MNKLTLEQIPGNAFLNKEGHQEGPYSVEQINGFLLAGQVQWSDWVWAEGWSDWKQLSSLVPSGRPLSSSSNFMRSTITTDSGKESNACEWHYAINGIRSGPVSEGQIIEMIRCRSLDDTSFVWNNLMSTWESLPLTKFAHLLRDPNVPPPLLGAAVNNSYVWWLAFAPLLGDLLQGVINGITGVPRNLWFITLILNIALSYIDENKLTAAGHDTSKMGAAWIVPVYLFKRAQILKQTPSYFIVWCILFILSCATG